MRAAFLAAIVLIAACSGTRAAVATPKPLQAVLVATELAVGESQRLGIGILEEGTPVNDAAVHVRAYRQSPTDPLLSESDAPFKGDGLQGKGVYVAKVKLAAPGMWQIEVGARRPSGANGLTKVTVQVLRDPTVPAVGQRAPLSRNRTVKDGADVAELDSGTPPSDMHEVSIADAIAQHRPALIVFATPAFCTSATCGPEVRAVQALEPAYRDRLAFIHVEIYENFRPDPSTRRLTPTVEEWKLRSEPWVFLVDAQGIIRASFEGPTATDELKEAIERLFATR